MALINIKPCFRKDESLDYNEVLSIDTISPVTRLTEIPNGSLMVYCGKDFKGFYNGYHGELLEGLGWNRC
jgi:hypothetical protein